MARFLIQLGAIIAVGISTMFGIALIGLAVSFLMGHL